MKKNFFLKKSLEISWNEKKIKKIFFDLPGEGSGGSEKSWFLGFGPLRATFAKDTFSFEQPFYEKSTRRRRKEKKKKERKE